MGMLLRRYYETANEVKPTTYEDVKGVAEKVAPFVDNNKSKVEVVGKPKKAISKKK